MKFKETMRSTLALQLINVDNTKLASDYPIMDNEKDLPDGIAKGTENITARAPLKTQTKIGINRRQDQNKPYSKPSEPKSKSSSQQTTSPGEISQKADQEFDNMNKKIRISQQSYRQIIANNKKQGETIENLMEIIKQQTERIENLEKQQRKEESEMEVVEIKNREENEIQTLQNF